MSEGPILLLWALGIGLIAGEVFLPGAILGVLGVLCLAASVGWAFVSLGTTWGAGLSVASVLVGGGLGRWAVRSVALTADLGELTGTDDHGELIGRRGVSATVLRPGGFATIDGRRVDVVTAGEMIEVGTPVEVVKVEGNRIEVRALG